MKYRKGSRTFIENENFKNKNLLNNKKNKSIFKQFIIATAKKYNITVKEVEDMILKSKKDDNHFDIK